MVDQITPEAQPLPPLGDYPNVQLPQSGDCPRIPLGNRSTRPVRLRQQVGFNREMGGHDGVRNQAPEDPVCESGDPSATFALRHQDGIREDSCRTLNVVARRRRTHRAKRTRELIRRCHPRRVRRHFFSFSMSEICFLNLGGSLNFGWPTPEL